MTEPPGAAGLKRSDEVVRRVGGLVAPASVRDPVEASGVEASDGAQGGGVEDPDLVAVHESADDEALVEGDLEANGDRVVGPDVSQRAEDVGGSGHTYVEIVPLGAVGGEDVAEVGEVVRCCSGLHRSSVLRAAVGAVP